MDSKEERGKNKEGEKKEDKRKKQFSTERFHWPIPNCVIYTVYWFFPFLF